MDRERKYSQFEFAALSILIRYAGSYEAVSSHEVSTFSMLIDGLVSVGQLRSYTRR